MAGLSAGRLRCWSAGCVVHEEAREALRFELTCARPPGVPEGPEGGCVRPGWGHAASGIGD